MDLATCRAFPEERRRAMLADGIVADALVTATNAITIEASTAAVWPWLAQLGSGRAGWYSYDHIDNGGRASARCILPEYQRLAPGDVVPALPGATGAFVVSSVTPASRLVLTAPDAAGGARVSWEYLLEPLGLGRTRLIMRGRVSPRWPSWAPGRLTRRALLAVARLGHGIMLSRHLRGIKRRAEGWQVAPAMPLNAARAGTPVAAPGA